MLKMEVATESKLKNMPKNLNHSALFSGPAIKHNNVRSKCRRERFECTLATSVQAFPKLPLTCHGPAHQIVLHCSPACLIGLQAPVSFVESTTSAVQACYTMVACLDCFHLQGWWNMPYKMQHIPGSEVALKAKVVSAFA